MVPNLEGEQVGKDVRAESTSARSRGLEECVCIKYTKSTGVCSRGQERSTEGPSSDPQGRQALTSAASGAQGISGTIWWIQKKASVDWPFRKCGYEHRRKG